MPFRPEQVEEEGTTEDGGDVYADEDVERGDANVVIVVDEGFGELVLHEILLVDVVYSDEYLIMKGVVQLMYLTRRQFLSSRSPRRESWRIGR